jgi:hypothetical protein
MQSEMLPPSTLWLACILSGAALSGVETNLLGPVHFLDMKMFPDSFSAFCAQKNLINSLEEWSEQFEKQAEAPSFYANCGKTGCNFLRAQYEMCYSFLNTYRTGRQTAFDEYLPNYERILDILDLTFPAGSLDSLGNPTAEPFSLDQFRLLSSCHFVIREEFVDNPWSSCKLFQCIDLYKDEFLTKPTPPDLEGDKPWARATTYCLVLTCGPSLDSHVEADHLIIM